MKRIRIVGLCLVVSFAMTAVAASSASATAPEFGICKKVAAGTGKFESATCVDPGVPGKEAYEWEALPHPVTLSGKMKASTLATLETVKGTKITCKGETNTGEIANPKEVANVVAKFTGCESSTFPCENTGAGEITTKPLSGVIGYETKGTDPPENNKLAEELHGPGGGSLAEFTCAGIPIVVTGSVLHNIHADSMVNKLTEKFSATKGEQKPEKFLGGVTDEHILESSTGGGTPEEAGQTIAAEVTLAEKVEANTVA